MENIQNGLEASNPVVESPLKGRESNHANILPSLEASKKRKARVLVPFLFKVLSLGKSVVKILNEKPSGKIVLESIKNVYIENTGVEGRKEIKKTETKITCTLSIKV